MPGREYLLAASIVAALLIGFAAGMIVSQHFTIQYTVLKTITATSPMQHYTSMGEKGASPAATQPAGRTAAGEAGFSQVPLEYREVYRLAVRLRSMLSRLPEEARKVILSRFYSYPLSPLPPAVLPREWITITMVTPAATPPPLLGALHSTGSKYVMQSSYTLSTNLQVSGVDEPDIVKTNGTHLFVERGNGEIVVVKAYPPDSMRQVARIEAASTIEKLVGPAELILRTGNETITLGKAKPRIRPRGILVDSHGDVVALYDVYFEVGNMIRRWLPSPASLLGALLLRPSTWILVFSPDGHLIHHAWVNGWLVDARLDGDKLVVVTRFTREFWWASPLRLEPGWTSWGKIPLSSTAVLGLPTATTTIISVFNTVNWSRYAVSLTGPAPRFIYMTRDGTVYILLSPALFHTIRLMERLIHVIEHTPLGKLPSVLRELRIGIKHVTPWTTLIIKVSTKNWRPVITGRRVVEGTPSSQFAIDVYKGYLRLALQRGIAAGFNVYILNATTLAQVSNMTVPLRLERVHAIRFIGDKLYIVTYRSIDPLFVIDLSNPCSPRILGYREGPGFDQYIHPINETAIVGLGLDAKGRLRLSTYIVATNGDVERVSYVTLPDHFSLVFTRSGYHAFILDEKHHMIMFPGTVRHIPVEVNGRREVMTAGNFYIVPYNPVNLTLGRPRIIEGGYLRGIVIDNAFYAVSPARIAAYTLPSLKPITVVELH